MDGYRDAVDRMDEPGLETEMQAMLRRWDLDDDASRERYEASPVDALKRIYANFDIAATGHDAKDAAVFIRQHVARASTVYHAMFTRGMFDATPAYKTSMQNLLRVLLYAQNTVINLSWCRAAMKPHADDSHVDDHIIARFSPIDTEDNTPFQNLLLYLLNQAYAKNYRKHLGFCYEAIHRGGYNTHAWKNVCTVQEFVYDVTNKEMHFDQWKNLTHGRDNARAAAEYLSKCKDGQFPDLIMDRHVFAFRNGVYHCAHREFEGAHATDAFYAFDDGKKPNGPSARPVPPHLTACKFFDLEFDNFDGVDDWQDIPTPHLQSILAYQKFSKEVCRWMYVFLGRLLFDVGELDGWQVIPFLKGMAGCHARGTPIMMYDGRTKLVEDVAVGDVLMGDDSTPRTVLSLARGRDPMYRIVPTKSNASSYVVNGKHILCLVFSGHGSVAKYKYGFVVHFWNHDRRCISMRKFKTMELVDQFKESIRDLGIVEMTVEEYLLLPKYIQKYLKAYRVGVDFPTVEEPPIFDPWLLGYWLGDGNSADTGITTADEDIVQKIREILPSSLHFNAVGTAKYKYRITTGERKGIGGTNEFMNALRAYGLVNNKHIPHVLKTGSRDTRMRVLAGLLDSDGYLEVGDTCYEITQKSETLARDIEFVARSLGFGCYIIECQKSCTVRGKKKTGTYYRMHISGAGLEDLPMVLERKKAKSRVLSRNVLHYGFDVEPLEEDDYFGFIVDANHRYLLGDFTATHNSGKCFSKGTPVLMYDGTIRPIETIAIGDRVMGDDSAPRTVRTLARGDDEMFRIVPTKGEPFVVTREHVLCLKYSSHGVVQKSGDGFVVSIFDSESKRTKTKYFADLDTAQKFSNTIDSGETFEMTVDEYLNLSKSVRERLMGYRVSTEFPAVHEEPLFDPWLLGYWLGDGTSSDTGITTADEDIVQKIRDILPSSLHFNAVGTAKYKYRITTGERKGIGGTNEFINMLKSYDLVNNKHIPHVLKTGSRDTRLKLLAGLLDSDGYLEVGDTCYEITQKSETLARDIEFVARSLGFGCSITECQKSCTLRSGEKKTGTYYRMHISGAGLEDLPMVLERKKAKNRIRNKDVLRYGISSIEPAGVQAYYGFECDGNHRFLLGDFSVTHNSTVVLKVAREFYDANDVGILSNNIEKKFGLSAFHDKFLFCAPEVKSDLHIEQAEFQSMVSGESLQINEKFKTAKSIEWRVPGILAGNEVPTWCDNAGSIARRVVLFDFERKVTHGDMELGKKLEREMPAILKKCASAYLEAARKYGNQNVWNYLPAYFKNLQSEMAAATNSLENFLQSEKIVLGEDLYCDWQSFIRAAQAHAREYNFNLKTVSKDFYSGPFDKYKITLDKTKKKALKYPRNDGGETRRCFWVFGCDLAANVVETEERSDEAGAL